MPTGSYQDESNCSATSLRKASRRVTLLYDGVLAPAGLTVTQYGLLAELVRKGNSPPTVTELAKSMVMDRSGLLHTLGPLIRDGYISLVVNPVDGRSRQVVITQEGKALQRKASLLWSRAQAKFREAVGSAEAEKLHSALLRIAHSALEEDQVEVADRGSRKRERSKS